MTIKSICRTFALISIIAVFNTPLTRCETADNFISMGDSLYISHDYDGSIVQYEKACLQDSNMFEAFWKLGRSLNLKGELAERDSELVIFEKARIAIERALELNEGDADAHFQLARALGKIALHKGIFKSASLAKKVKGECERALEIDSLHDGALHILGRWHREVGKKPKILRIPMGLGAANKEDALALMGKAVKINPTNINHHLEMGNTYLRFKYKDRAREEYEECLKIEAGGLIDEKYQKEAKKNLAEMDKN